MRKKLLDFGIKTNECGLFVSLDYPYLGTLPDAIADDSAVVEIKCSSLRFLSKLEWC